MLSFIKIAFYLLFLFKNHLVIANEQSIHDDLYSSVAMLEKVLAVERLHIETLENYISKTESEIKALKISIRIFQNQTNAPLKYNSIVSQPLLNFQSNIKGDLKLITFSSDAQINKFKIILEFLKKFEDVNTIYKRYVPIQSDVNGAISGLLRLQKIYGFTAEQISTGNLSDKIQLTPKLTAYDCFTIGQKLSELNVHDYAIGWYKAALNRIKEAREMNLQNFLPLNEQEIRNLLQLSELLKSDTLNETDKLLGFEDLELLQLACRGHLKKDPSEVRKLFCKYERENHPFLTIAPLKVEILNFSPYLVIYYNIISDLEIEILIELSQNNLERAPTWNDDEGKDTNTNYRISKNTWLDDDIHPLINTLNQRMHDMTGLSLKTSEVLQIANYGIGGHYDIHFDYSDHSDDPRFNKSEAFGYEWGFGDRIATILFYLSDVPLGGSTVWPYINVKVDPVKGSAAFWYNLHYSLEGNVYTLHSSCPVVIGSKWAANKWIWSQDQMFKRPCLLEFDTSAEKDIEIDRKQ